MLVFKSTILLVFLSIFTAVLAKTVTHDWNITWATANPDGMFDRRVYSINGQWPVPILEVDIGDRVIINMENGLGDRDTSLHFHGLFQNGTVEMDGPAFVTQCPVAPGQRITYNFTACTLFYNVMPK
jgi:iron transport multicopper oxidase